jgi:hypothetical protein
MLLSAVVASVLALSGGSHGVLARTAGDTQGEYEWPHFYPDDPLAVDRDCFPVPEPSEIETSQYYDFLENTFFGVGRGRNPGALNANTLGEVPNSSWFTNRIGFGDMRPEEIIRGAKSGDGPDLSGPWNHSRIHDHRRQR